MALLALLAVVGSGLLGSPADAQDLTSGVVCDGAGQPELGDVDPATGPSPVAPGTDLSGTEHIASYDVDVELAPDSSAVFTETIAYDFGVGERHGIFRDLVTRQPCNDEFDRVYPLSEVSVQSETAPDQFALETWEHGDRIRIGDPDRTITGQHTYTISYRLDGVVNGFPDHDEFYWNVIGDDWGVPILDITAVVRAPESPEQVTCFAGPTFSRATCTAADISEGAARFAQEFLPAYENLTVVAGLAKGAVAEPQMILEERWSLGRAFSLTPFTGLGALLLLGVVVGGWGVLAFRVGRDHQVAGSHVDVAFAPVGAQGAPVGLFEDRHSPVEFVPPDRIRPGQVGVLVDEIAHAVDVTATIIDLAVRGYLRIEEIPSGGRTPDFRLVRLEKDTTRLFPYELLLLDELVARPGDSTMLSDLKYEFVSEFKQVVNAMYDEVVTRGWFRRRPDKTRHRWLAIGLAAVVVTGGILALLIALTDYALLGVPLVLGALLLLVGARWMPRRTPAGTGMLSRVKGFEVFIEDSEAPRARWAEQRNIFSEYLPYAIVFRCADRWAGHFEDLGAEALSASGGWYVGTHPFSAYYLSAAMTDFSSRAGKTLSTPEPSSSGGSGFSGGGFSGGGGGGGGGGSW